MSGEVNTHRRSSSLSERMQRVFTPERSTRRQSSNQDCIGPRRLSFSEHIQQVFHREKPEPPSVTSDNQDCTGQVRNAGSRRPSLSEHIQRAFHHEKSAGARLSRDRGSAGRDLNMDAAKKPPTQRDTAPSRTPSLSSLLPKRASMTGVKAKINHPTAVAIASTSPASSTIPKQRTEPLSLRNVTQDLSENSFQSWPRSPQNRASAVHDSRSPLSEIGNANRRGKRATIRLEAERMDLERRIRRLEEAERREFEKRLELLRDAERKEFDRRMEAIQGEQKKTENPAIAYREKKADGPTKEVQPATPNGVTVPQTPRRRLTKKQPFTLTTTSNSRPSTAGSDTSRSSSRFSSAAFTSLFSSRVASRSRSNSSTRVNGSPGGRPSTEGSVVETMSHRRLSMSPQEPFMKAVSAELALKKNPLLVAAPTAPPETAPGHNVHDIKNTDEHDPDEEYFTADEFD